MSINVSTATMTTATATTAASSSTMDEKINQMIATTTTSQSSNNKIAAKVPYFILSETWKGSKQGYYFSTTEEYGTGYFLDGQQQTTNNNNKRKYLQQHNGDNNDVKDNIKKSVRFSTATKEELLTEAELQVSPYTKILTCTKTGINQSVTTLQKTMQTNQIQRVEHTTQPDKFLNSEVSLYEEILSWKSLASVPKLYKYVIQETTWLDCMIEMLVIHENLDVQCAIVNVLVELLDLSLIDEDEEDEEIRENLQWFAQACVFWKSINTTDGDSEEQYDFIVVLSNVLVNLSIEKQQIGKKKKGESNKDNNQENDMVVQKGIEDVIVLLDVFLEMDTINIFSSSQDNNDDSTSPMIILPKIASTNLIPWILEQIGANTTTYTKEKLQYSEFLFSLLQQETTNASSRESTENNNNILLTLSSCNNNSSASSDDNNDDKHSTKIDGIEMLLQGIAPYRKKDPSTSLDEVETLENYINSLCSILLFSNQYKLHFIKLQGLELMIHCLKSLYHVGMGALKVIESCFFFSGNVDDDCCAKQACELFINANGFKFIFPIVMGRSIPKPSSSSNVATSKKAKKEWLSTIEECCIQILYAMTRFLNNPSGKEGCCKYESYERFIVKFIEKDHEKCVRLTELCLKYDRKQRKAESKFYKSEEADYYHEQNQQLDKSEEDLAVDIDLLAFEHKLKHGGDIFHRLGAIIAFICVGSKRCHEFILEGLRIRRSGIGVIKASVEEFMNVLEDGDQKLQLMKYQEHI